ncbi:hypothetical protein BD410DRAFT_334389 [Rickenella mellea]|uniref:Uncharacterized protein n=1 Tax=Rickenella mellea TaxID=50990 RepID=A0A4Y7QJL4_9AGAM|nr:hypothetical protein BD410DRAFT_334389 [Rickenella mellea]
MSRASRTISESRKKGRSRNVLKKIDHALILPNETVLFPCAFTGNSNTTQTHGVPSTPSINSSLKKPVIIPAPDGQGLSIWEVTMAQGANKDIDSTRSSNNAVQPFTVQRCDSGTQTHSCTASTVRQTRSQTVVTQSDRDHTTPNTAATIVEVPYLRSCTPKSSDEPHAQRNVDREAGKRRELSYSESPMQMPSSCPDPQSNMRSRRNRTEDLGCDELDVLPRKRHRIRVDETKRTGTRRKHKQRSIDGGDGTFNRTEVRRRRAQSVHTVTARKAARKTPSAKDNEECTSSRLFNSCLQGFRGVRAMSEQVVSTWRDWKDAVNVALDSGSS